MAGTVPMLYWFDRWDERIGLLRVVGELVHTEELNGEDTLEFQSYEVPAKGDRLLWLDGSTWREHVVVRTDEPLAGLCSVYAESSLCELLDDFIEEAQLVSRTARQVLAAVLEPTRWAIAYCASLGTAGCLIYHQNALWALRRVAEVWGGEVTPVIAVSDGRVASRSIRLDSQRGEWRGLRFTYGKNMAGCTRTVLEQDVYTALYGFGAGLPFTDEEGNYKAGYRRKLTFGEGVVARVTIGTVEPVDYAQVSALTADVAALQDDVVGIDGNLSTAASVTVVESTVTTAIDDLDELADLDF